MLVLNISNFEGGTLTFSPAIRKKKENEQTFSEIKLKIWKLLMLYASKFFIETEYELLYSSKNWMGKVETHC